MLVNALFLAMDNFFRQVVNFSEQSFVGKVAVAYFATIAERQIALPWRLRLYLTALHTSRFKRGLDYDSTLIGRTLSHNPKSVCLKFATGWATYANTIGVRVHTRAYTGADAYVQAWRLWPLSLHLHHIHDSWQDWTHWRKFVRIWNPQKNLRWVFMASPTRTGLLPLVTCFAVADMRLKPTREPCFVSLCSDESHAYLTRHVQLYSLEIGDASRMDAKPDIARRKEKEVPQERPKPVPGITMKNLLLNADSPQRFNPAILALRKQWSTD